MEDRAKGSLVEAGSRAPELAAAGVRAPPGTDSARSAGSAERTLARSGAASPAVEAWTGLEPDFTGRRKRCTLSHVRKDLSTPVSFRPGEGNISGLAPAETDADQAPGKQHANEREQSMTPEHRRLAIAGILSVTAAAVAAGGCVAGLARVATPSMG